MEARGQPVYVCMCMWEGVAQEQLSLIGTWNLLIRPEWLISEPRLDKRSGRSFLFPQC